MGDYDAYENDGKFYINWGRWANSVCGPFDTWSEATQYANNTKARDFKVMRLAPPTPQVKTYVVTENRVEPDDYGAMLRDNWIDRHKGIEIIHRSVTVKAPNENEAFNAARAVLKFNNDQPAVGVFDVTEQM